MKFISYTLVALLSAYSVGCFQERSKEETHKIDSTYLAMDRARQELNLFNQRKDNLTVILQGTPQISYNIGSANEALIAGRTLDGKLKILRFTANSEIERLSTILTPDSRLTFTIPKNSLEKVDSSTTIYDFKKAPGNCLDYIVSVDGMPFSK
jgi:hypothetical protein